MNRQDEQRKLWRDVLGSDTEAIWQAFAERTAPPLNVRFEPRSSDRKWRWATAAAVALASLSLLWNWHISTQLASTRTEYALALLETGSSPVRLQALGRLSNSKLSPASVIAIRKVVSRSRDPGVQLAALDVLIGSGSLDVQLDTQELLQQVTHNRAFIEFSLRMRPDEQRTTL